MFQIDVPSRRFRTLLTRLVFQDAKRPIIWGFGLFISLALFVSRHLPPWDVRNALQTSDPLTQVLLLYSALLLYAFWTRSVVRILVRSKRLEYFKHFPFSQKQWAFLHLRNLMGLNVPWSILSFYVLCTGKHGMHGVHGWSWWLVSMGLTSVTQLTCIQQRSRFVLGTTLLFSILYSTMYTTHTLYAVVLLCGVSGLAWYEIQHLTTLKTRTVRMWWPFTQTPIGTWMRLEWALLWRQHLHTVYVRCMWVSLCFAVLVLSIINNALYTPNSLYSLTVGLLFPAALLTASLPACIQNERHGHLWWDLHLGISIRTLVGVRWGLGGILALPLPILACIALYAMRPTSNVWLYFWVVCAGWSICIWATSVSMYTTWSAQKERRLQDGIFKAVSLYGFFALLIWFIFPWIIWLLPLHGIYLQYRSHGLLHSLHTQAQSNPPLSNRSSTHTS